MKLFEPTDSSIGVAAEALNHGQLVAFPTETVYGLGANAWDGQAVAKIFDMKGRPRFNPLIVHISDLEIAEKLAHFNDLAYTLATHFWPGALTLILKKREGSGLSDLVSAGLETVALRIPNHPVAQELLKVSGCPVAAPSANLSGHVSPTKAEHVASDFENHNLMILDGGPTEIGLESTVINCIDKHAVLMRPGGIETNEIEALVGDRISVNCQETQQPLSPGQLASHYAPNSSVRLNAEDIFQDEALLAFGPFAPKVNTSFFNLSQSGDLKEAAANLFYGLRTLDKGHLNKIAVMPIPNTGLGEAINDRLKRAAFPKER